MFYFIIFIFIATLSILDVENKHQKLRNEISFLIIFGLFIIAGLRFETGIDWLQYTTNFKTIKSFGNYKIEDFFSHLDIGFLILSSFVKTIGGGIQLLFVIMQILTTYFLWKSLKSFTELRISALLIYFSILFFHLDMNLMRQALAVNIFFYSLHLISEKKIIKFVFFIILATSFHWSAILFLPLYFFINKKFSTILLSSLIFSFILFYILKIETGNFVFDLVTNIFGSESSIANKAGVYTSQNIYSVKRLFSLGFISNVIIVTSTLIYRKKLESKIQNFDLLLNLMIMQLFFYCVLYEYIEISGRLRFYTLFSYIIILPYLIHVFKSSIEKYLAFLFIVLYCFAYSSIYMTKNIKTISYNPYQNYLLHETLKKNSNGKIRLMKYHENFNKDRKNKNRQ